MPHHNGRTAYLQVRAKRGMDAVPPHLVARQAHHEDLGPQCHSRAGGNPAAGSPARIRLPRTADAAHWIPACAGMTMSMRGRRSAPTQSLFQSLRRHCERQRRAAIQSREHRHLRLWIATALCAARRQRMFPPKPEQLQTQERRTPVFAAMRPQIKRQLTCKPGSVRPILR